MVDLPLDITYLCMSWSLGGYFGEHETIEEEIFIFFHFVDGSLLSVKSCKDKANRLNRGILATSDIMK